MDSIKAYLKDIRHIPLLTATEEVELARKVRKGNKEAQRKMIRSNLRLVITIAKRYIHFGIPFMDLIEEGNMGLMRAVEKFNPQRKCRFSTYAAWWIRQAVSRAISQQSRMIRLPAYMSELVVKQKRTNEELSQRLGRTPSQGELAKAMDLPLDKIRKIISWATKTSSLETPVGEEGEDEIKNLIEDTNIESPKQEISRIFNKEKVNSLLERMDERERALLTMRFGLKDGRPRTLAEIGRRFGVSRERIRQIEKVALKKLRKFSRSQEKGEIK